MAGRIVRRRTPSLKTWLGQDIPAFGSDVSAGIGLISPGLKAFGTPGSEDVTILRTRGVLSAVVLMGTLDLVQIALGIGLCTTEAALAGAVPLPFDNPEWDGWFVYQVSGLIKSSGATGASNGEMIIDSKAMRKIPAGQVLFLATQLFTAGGAGGDTVTESIQIRQLQKTS